jgi:hypothetical protein
MTVPDVVVFLEDNNRQSGMNYSHDATIQLTFSHGHGLLQHPMPRPLTLPVIGAPGGEDSP